MHVLLRIELIFMLLWKALTHARSKPCTSVEQAEGPQYKMVISVQGVEHACHLSRQHFGGRDNYTAQHSAAADGMEEAKAESRRCPFLPYSDVTEKETSNLNLVIKPTEKENRDGRTLCQVFYRSLPSFWVAIQ